MHVSTPETLFAALCETFMTQNRTLLALTHTLGWAAAAPGDGVPLPPSSPAAPPPAGLVSLATPRPAGARPITVAPPQPLPADWLAAARRVEGKPADAPVTALCGRGLALVALALLRELGVALDGASLAEEIGRRAGLDAAAETTVKTRLHKLMYKAEKEDWLSSERGANGHAKRRAITATGRAWLAEALAATA